MSRIFFISLSSLCTLVLFGQSTFKQESFILKGQLKECPEKFLVLYFEDDNYLNLSDTININEDGTFYLKSFKTPMFKLFSINPSEFLSHIHWFYPTQN